MILGAALPGSGRRPGLRWWGMAGGLAPDLSLYLLVAAAMLFLDIPARVVFGEFYYSHGWQRVFSVDNSIPLWGLAFGAALWRRSWAGMAFCGGGLLHLAFDLALHGEDARMHLWPLSAWKFDSPFSYWDPARGGVVIGLGEMTLSAATAFWLWRQEGSPWLRTAFTVLLAAELMTGHVWHFVF